MISSQASSGGAVQTGMLWWKVELDKSGAILSVEQVADVAKGSKLVAYVQATTKAGACTAAKEWWCEYAKERRRLYEVRRDRLRDQGICVSCAKAPRSLGKVHCSKCHERKLNRRHDLNAGAPKLRERLDGPEARRQAYLQNQKNSNERRARYRCQMMYSALWDKFRELGHLRFERWLIESMKEAERAERGLDLAEAAE